MEVDRFPIPQIPPTTPVRRITTKNNVERNNSFRNLLLSRDGHKVFKKANSFHDLRHHDGLVEKRKTNKSKKIFSFSKLFPTKKKADTPQSLPREEEKNNFNHMKHPYISDSSSRLEKSQRKKFRWNHFRSKSLKSLKNTRSTEHFSHEMVNRLPRPDKNVVIPNLLPQEEEEEEEFNEDNKFSLHSNISAIRSEGKIKDEDANQYLRMLKLAETKVSRDQSCKKGMNNLYNDVGEVDHLDKYLEIAMSPEKLEKEMLPKEYHKENT